MNLKVNISVDDYADIEDIQNQIIHEAAVQMLNEVMRNQDHYGRSFKDKLTETVIKMIGNALDDDMKNEITERVKTDVFNKYIRTKQYKELKMYMNKPLNLSKSSDELKQLIAENPDLPIVVLVGRYAVSDDYGYTYCSDIHFSIEEILDCTLPFGDDYVYNDRDDFEDALSDYLADCEEYENLSDEEFQTLLIKELNKYEPYWKKVIAIKGDN